MTFKLIFYYIAWSIRLRIPPWYYFQINAEWYNKEKGFYSKIDIDKYIPTRWRLQQAFFDKNKPPKIYPVFLKPEWGQNSNGIIRIDSKEAFLAFDDGQNNPPYIVQQAASELKEYEIFYIRDADNVQCLIELTITRSINHSDERYPINSINNTDVTYEDCTKIFTADELKKIRIHLQELPNFRIARVGLHANSKSDLVNGDFHIIEVNLFAPFPINLLDKRLTKQQKHQFIKTNMYHLVRVSNTTPKSIFNRFVFVKKIVKHYQTKWQQN
ncbi:hypothetical protein [uncultured Gammaproteobacteria bacterium]|uniref:hypothetical protein n=1 Tax=Bathymodiolus heckerae thiotrophic gill symbiont TaxID=1052212 RepID=UPI0010BC7ABF|nr:hypothetical protein [Bathymodiolus heckerae thiotrophic gill symbiont]CAC9592989.1 hypothetical protein [uncultured Gammaproteobacteria bacterium]CAC9599742.1 hypothetical protein [uncultured Gammaproteobacteria bacterium]CAC9600725.1 hypothetical protein [uncultured Gammaproteobacteria bacterium]CAC9608077.1 hypothetical protein [uncultured Gammaproteobacteria bacterium]CAC9960814.1 hypothetical protein [uncultured Gammaproteobacteria bacterium]